MKSEHKQSWHSTLVTSIRKISEQHTVKVLPRNVSWFMHVKGEVKDPLVLKLLDAVNNENEQELEHILRTESLGITRVLNMDIRGGTLLHYACSRSNSVVVELLLRYGFDQNRRTSNELELYIEAYEYVSKFRTGSTPLYIATVTGTANVVAMLLKQGADPNIQDIEGYTPLHNAAWHNKVELMKQLLANGASANIQDITGSTPVRKAAYKGHLEAVRHLLGNGANANIRTKKGRAAVHCAALYGHTEVLDLLLQHGAQVNIQDNDDVTPLHAAVYNGKRLAVRHLLKSQADVNLRTKFGNTALHLACMERWYVIASLLVQAGANFETENRFGETPGTIMDTGNAGKRVNIFNRQNVPNMAELEKMEAEQKEQQASARSALIRQNGSSGGQLSITAVVDNTANNLDKREGRIEENRS